MADYFDVGATIFAFSTIEDVYLEQNKVNADR